MFLIAGAGAGDSPAHSPPPDLGASFEVADHRVLVHVPCILKRSVLLSIRIVSSLVLIGPRYAAHHAALRET